MSVDLEEVSKNFDVALDNLVNQWRAELRQVENDIEKLNQILQSSEAKTDRSENAVFQIAKDERDMKVGKQRTLQGKIDAYKQYTGTADYIPTGVVKEGTTMEVTLLRIDNTAFTGKNSRLIIKLVPRGLSQSTEGLVEVTTAFGIGVLGHFEGDLITISARKGNVQYKIERIY